MNIAEVIRKEFGTFADIGIPEPKPGKVWQKLDCPYCHASAASGYVCPLDDPAEPLVVGVVVAPDEPQRGKIMIGCQSVQAGLPHTGKTAEVVIDFDAYLIAVDEAVPVTAPWASSREVLRDEVFSCQLEPGAW